MLVLEYARIELDVCPSCRGTWFDAGEMDLLSERLGADAAALLPAASPEASRPCPLCRRPMEKVTAGPGGLFLDRCPRGEGIWFDRSEIAGSLPATDRVLAFLNDVFPHEKKEKGAP